ncbi:hypothetical protein R1sor_022581 [Riccia sorocarpa]|uniref:Uncharacterized protein n=1 Tax=Riccia sorocarpa TaxID=122646 RepID=A0ABD3GNF7_9MARC
MRLQGHFRNDNLCFCGYSASRQNENAGPQEEVSDAGDTTRNEGTRSKRCRDVGTREEAEGTMKKAMTDAAKPAKRKTSRRVPEKDMLISLTVGIAEEDVDGCTFDLLARFVEDKVGMGIIAMERDEAHLQEHNSDQVDEPEEDDEDPTAEESDDDYVQINTIVHLEDVILKPWDEPDKIERDLISAGYAVAREQKRPVLPEYIPLCADN